MTRTILIRVLSGAAVLVAVSLLVFTLVDLSPGNPATAKLGTFSTELAKQQFIEENGLDDPFLIRYVRSLGSFVQGDFGDSVVQPSTVGDLIARALPRTLQLSALAVLFALLIALTAGIVGAMNAGRGLDKGLEAATIAGVAAPDYWLGLVAINVFAIQLGWLPAGGYAPISDGIFEWFESLLMPALVLAVPLGSGLARILRSTLAEEMSRDYVRTARGLGLRPLVVVGRNALRNALLAPLTAFGLRLGQLLAGAIVVESVFNIPGMGSLLLTAVNQGDVAVVQGVALVSASIFVFLNLAVDMLYFAVNPRLRQ